MDVAKSVGLTLRRFAAALVALIGPGAALAWGPHGHQVVAEIAARELNATARAEVERLLGDRASNAMREASTWADEIREQERWRKTGSWHYVNFPRGDCHYERDRICHDGQCVVEAIRREARILGDRKASTDKRRNALRFVIHFVADAHQPLHAGYSSDRGGNDFQIRFGRQGGNLHGFWDQDIFRAERGRLSVMDHVSDLDAGSAPTGDLDWRPQAPPEWAEAACGIVQRTDFYPPNGVVSRGYVTRFAPIADDQLTLAGHRLAALLNDLLGGRR